MSLKFFHVVFVTFAILVLVWFGTWALRDYFQKGGSTSLALSVLSYLAGGAMLLYGSWFFKKYLRGKVR